VIIPANWPGSNRFCNDFSVELTLCFSCDFQNLNQDVKTDISGPWKDLTRAVIENLPGNLFPILMLMHASRFFKGENTLQF
jgi:hypothetical protein